MSAKVDQFFDQLRDRLHVIDEWLQSVRADIQSLPERAQNALRVKLEEAHTKLQAQKERVEQTRANLKAKPQQQMAETPGVIGEWKAKPVAREPDACAHPTEAHAADTIDHAMGSIDEVRDAMLYAAVAGLRDGTR